MDSLPKISIIVLLNEYKEFISVFNNNYKIIDYPQDLLEWIIIDDSDNNHMDLFPLEENVLYFHMNKSKEYLDRIEFKKDEDKIIYNYFLKTDTLPDGFKRDYGVGISSNDYIFHMDIDMFYKPKCIRNKLKFLRKNRLECIFCDSLLCYCDNKIYKTENSVRAFEGTLFHTRDFWKKGGFKWEDIINEGDIFHYNRGNDRKMDMYYDTIKYINIHNIQTYKLQNIKIDDKNIEKPKDMIDIIIKTNPIENILMKLFKKDYSILGLNSNIIENFDVAKENIILEGKIKEKNIIKYVKELNKDFNVLLFNYKIEIWNLFKEKEFNIILYETDKNFNSMKSILEKNNYIFYDNIFINKKFLFN